MSIVEVGNEGPLMDQIEELKAELADAEIESRCALLEIIHLRKAMNEAAKRLEGYAPEYVHVSLDPTSGLMTMIEAAKILRAAMEVP